MVMRGGRGSLEKKKMERKRSSSFLDGIPGSLPSLRRAYLLTRTVSKVGFDWPDLDGVLQKMEEELREFQEALDCGNRKRIGEEIGDLLFVLANISRFLRIDPEEALNRTIGKFISRFHYIEKNLRKRGKTVFQSDLAEMDGLWEEAKRNGRKNH